MSEPRLEAVLETTLYCAEQELGATLTFYEDTLGLRSVAAWADGTAYRLGAGVLIVFCRERLAGREGPISAHGSDGPGHVCLRAAAGDYERWRERIATSGVAIDHEHEWGERGRSFYFRDPAGNLLEIASADIWPA